MSGIFGIIRKHQEPLQQEWIKSMQTSLSHRGPDGSQIWQDEYAALGHLMLLTTPESCLEKQPLVYKHWVVTADVRLDNRKELFALLGIPPSLQPQTPDSLLIVKAFEKWQKRCPEFLVGDFAFAIWDKQQRTLFCAKDHAGVRQLYYYDSPHFIIFATEVRAIAQLEFIPDELDMDKFASYLIGTNYIGDYAAHTYIKGIKRLMPANWLNWENQSLSTYLYWTRNPNFKVKFNDPRDYGFALRELIEVAVQDRIRTNYPVGITLSGGLDSSSVACLAARNLAQKGKSLYSASSVLPTNHQGIEEDERYYIELVLKQEKNIIPSFVTADGISIFDGLEEKYDKIFQPVNAFHYMDEALSQSLAPHTRIILSGFAGDMTVSNRGHFSIPTLLKQGKFITAGMLLRSRKRITHQSYKKLFTSLVLSPLLPYDLRQALKKIQNNSSSTPFGILDTPVSTSFLSENKAKFLYKKYSKALLNPANPYTTIWNTSWVVFSSENDLLVSYRQQEPAYPFTDKRIIEFLWASPPECFDYKGWPRGYIRRAMEGIIPEEILWRKDKTMYTPDFQNRIASRLSELVPFLENQMTPQNNFFLNMPHLLASLKKVQPNQGWSSFDSKTISIVYTGIQGIKYLDWAHKTLTK